MKTFKDILQQDIKRTFLNIDEFGEMHDINGQEVTIIIDENELTEREKRLRRNEGELHKKQLLFYIAAEDFGNLPAPGKVLKLDQKSYIITDAEDEGGIYSISLEAVKS
ncbi:MAG: hypothetical protein NC416_08185 [Eubacterium sp.]|nr:hypothetical protein [Eubacterium sp.]